MHTAMQSSLTALSVNHSLEPYIAFADHEIQDMSSLMQRMIMETGPLWKDVINKETYIAFEERGDRY